jgi:hypothetical protein
MPITRAVSLVLAALLAFACSGAAEEKSRSQRINDAVEKGVAWLRGRQKTDGSFRGYHEGGYPTGVAALALLSLLKSGVGPNDPAIQKGVAYLSYKSFEKTYSTGLTLMVIDALNSKEYDAWAQRGADWLVSVRNKNLKIWGYPDGGPDLSNTQYAILGLQAAARRGAKVPPNVWLDVLDWMERQQADSGAITYTPGHRPSGSMTLAGIATALICMDEAEGDRRFQTKSRTYETVVRRAFDWFSARYSVESNPDGEGDASAVANLHYYLYGLERVGVLSNAKTIGGHDWYRDGSDYLLATQAQDGSWTAPGSLDAMSDTGFALLFLRRATVTLRAASPIAADAPDARRDSLNAKSFAAPAARPTPNPHLLFIREWLVLGPFPDPDDTELKKETINEKSAEPVAGQRLKGSSWTLHKSDADFISFEAAAKAESKCVGYAFTWLHALLDTEVVLFLGSDDGVKVILDGETVFYGHVHGAAKADQHVVPLRLTAGAHRLLVKIDNVAGPWGIIARIGAPDGGPPSGIVSSTRKRIDDGELRAARVVPLSERGYERIAVAPNAPRSWDKNSGVTADREPSRAFDGDPNTFWASDGPTLTTPKDVGVEFPEDVEIGAADIFWWATNHSPALDGYKLEAWSGGRWVPVADQLQRVDGAHWVHTFAPVKTRRFRVLVTKMPADADKTYRSPAIYEVTLYRKAGP